jgi:hypothetical protein
MGGGSQYRNDLDKNAPPGYVWDDVKRQYVPKMGSESDNLDQRNRTQGFEDYDRNRRMRVQDIGNDQEQQTYNDQRDMQGQMMRLFQSSLQGLGDDGSEDSFRDDWGRSGTGGDDWWLPQNQKWGGGGGVSQIDMNRLGPGADSVPFSQIHLAGAQNAPNAPVPVSLNPAAAPGANVTAAAAPARSSAAPWENITGPNQATQDAEESAVFGKVKDSAAGVASASLRGLGDELNARGMGGAGYEAGQIGGTLSREANTIGEGQRQWAGQRYQDANHRADINTQAGMMARGQDLNASTAERGQDVGLSEANLGSQTTQRGQDMSYNTANRGQDLDAAVANLGSQTTTRGQDMNAAQTYRGQDLGAAQSNMSGLLQRMGLATQERGQNLSAQQSNQSANMAGRGQDLSSWETGINAATTARGQDVSSRTAMHGQNLQARTAQMSLRLQKQNSLREMLMNALRGFGGGPTAPHLTY